MITPVMPTYSRMPNRFVRAEGLYMYDEAGKAHLDFYAGIGVSALGHCHPHLVKTLQDQAEKVWHISNLYDIPEQERLAARYAQHTFADTAFFTNSGAESIECAIKMVRAYHSSVGNKRFRIITMASAFHGRTLAGIAAAGQEKMIQGFEPVPDGFDVVPFGDLDAVKAVIGPETGGIMIEPVQGEGGIRVIPTETLRALRAIADEHDLLLVCDEIQCGMGRTGKFWAFEHAGIEPDVVTAAKGIGCGFPVGACFATEKAARGMVPGTHGSTYGGNPLAMAVCNAVFDILMDDAFLANVTEKGAMLHARLAGLQQRFPDVIAEVRGKGLMAGLHMPTVNTRAAVEDLVSRGLCAAPAGDSVLRMLPPLILEDAHIDEAIHIIETALTDWAATGYPQ